MLPDGFEERHERDLRVWALRGYADGAIAATAPERSAGAARGRVRFVELSPSGPAAAPVAVAVRHYFRGGFLAPLMRDFHLDPLRPLREIALYRDAAVAGVPTLEPVAGISRRAAGPLWRCDLITRAVPGARDLGDLVPDLARSRPAERAPVLAAVARAIRALHDAGFEHRDLNLKNVLVVRDPEPRALVIDLDGARRHAGPVPAAARRANILRLYRSSQKIGGRAGVHPSAADLIRFVRAYAGGDEAEARALAALPLPKHTLRRMLWASQGARA